MRVFRARSNLITSVLITSQLAAALFVAATLVCGQGVAMLQEPSGTAIANCPMHHDEMASAEPSCPFHTTKKGAHECDCPTLGCAQTDNGFIALFGPVGVLPAPSIVATPRVLIQTIVIPPSSTSSFAVVPPAPPPRA